MAEAKVKVIVKGVYAHQDKGVVTNHFILFKDETKRRTAIFVGQFEAWAISLALNEPPPDRPFTHDAMLACLAVAGATLVEAYINDLREETFYALIALQIGEERHEVDVRPSDAIALALRANCPIFISEEIMRISSETDQATT